MAVLQGQAKATEPDFLALGADLQALYEAASELASQAGTSTGRLHAHLAAHRFSGVDGVVAESVRSLEDSVREVAQRLQRLRAMNEGLASMRPQMERIGRVGVLLQSTAVGFAVESARTQECQQAFGSFVDEIRGLSRRTQELESRIGAELGEACVAETAALVRLERELNLLQELARQLGQTSTRTAAEVQSRLDGMGAALAGQHEQSGRIRQQTEEAVFHMQFGDIVRQKIEHIVEALEQLSLRSTAPGVRHGQALPAAARTLAVQIAQLEMVEAELSTARRQLGGAFTAIAETAAVLAGTGGPAKPGQESGVGDLLGSLEQLNELVADGVRLRRQAVESAAQAFGVATHIAAQMQQVQAINREMHLLALNAIVKTAALGTSGATLEVLSMQVHELYREADQAVAEIDALAQRLGEDAGPGSGGATESSAAGERLMAMIEQVRADAGDFARTTELLQERGGQTRQKLGQTVGRLAALDRFAEQLQQGRTRLIAARSVLEPWIMAAAGAADLPDEEARYTMQSERDVHRRIAASATDGSLQNETRRIGIPDTEPPKAAGAASDSGVPPLVGSTDTTAGDSLGDNVELF